MCGIIGVLGKHQAAPILIEGLKRLEYRGYDSAGIATVNGGRLGRRRAVGKMAHLNDLLVHEPLAGATGIGHTRWATHGGPSLVNAHPHVREQVAVVHNGIIENYRELRAELARNGVLAKTQTDTEVVAMLCDGYLHQGLAPAEAARRTIAQLQGAYALCFLFEDEEDLIVAARHGSPLAIGWGQGEMFIGSDALALAPLTSEITYLEEDDLALVTRAGCVIEDSTSRQVQRERRQVDVQPATVGKDGHRHYMAKEIAEQPTVLRIAAHYYLELEEGRQILTTVDFSKFDRVVMVACGTASLACLTAKYWFEQIAELPVEVDIASEFRYRAPPVSERTLAIFVSQSGETADTLAALRYCRGKAGMVLSVVNAPESSIARESDLALPIWAGPEIGVASTKAFTCQLLVMAALALEAARQTGDQDAGLLRGYRAQLQQVPEEVSAALFCEPDVRRVAQNLAQFKDAIFLGRGALYPLALEGALKLKEISYIHAEGYASGELKHGPIALIDENMPVVVLAPRGDLFGKAISNMQEVMARGGKIVMVSCDKGLKQGADEVWDTIAMPAIEGPFVAISYAVAVQILAYYTALEKGTDVDQPRNLAKSVTVE